MKNTKNILFRLIGLLLCAVMLFAVVSCTQTPEAEEGEDISDTEAETEPVETMKVVVFSVKSVKGNILNKYRLELADVPVTDLPIDPITNIDDAIGKYLLEDANKGTCVSASMLGLMDPLVSAHGIGNDYVLITDVINANTDIKDMSDIIQKAIEENPGKTIYFPDGKYQLSKTVVIPSDPSKSVSFRLSNYARFLPSDDWKAENTALIQYGDANSAKTQSGDHSDYFMGGIIDADGRLTAIEVNGGGRLLISNVSIKNSKIGIHLKPNAAYNDIENVNVTSPNTRETKGIFVEGTNNTFLNMRIYRVLVGAHLTGGDNVLINIHPLFSGTNTLDSIGFHDQSTGNRYSICYSDQFTIGFKLDSQTRSYFDMCYMYWWQACSYQIGFMCTGEFNSIISDTVVSMQNVKNNGSGTQNHYLYFVDESADAEETPEETPNTTPSTQPEETPNTTPSTQPEETPEQTTPEQSEEKPEQQAEEDNNQSESKPTRPSRPNWGEQEEEEAVNELKAGTPSGSGIIINPSIQSEKNNDSDTYLQFVYDPN